jgi:hypothetical protein
MTLPIQGDNFVGVFKGITTRRIKMKLSIFIGFLLLLSYAQAVEEVAYPLPDQRQTAWQKREIEILVHFGINTFTGHEWGGRHGTAGSIQSEPA